MDVVLKQTVASVIHETPQKKLHEAIEMVCRRKRQEDMFLRRLRKIGPEPLCLSVSLLENNAFGITLPVHQRPKRVPGALEYNAPEDPLQFGNAVMLPTDVRESGVSMLWIVNVTATFFTGVRFKLKLHAYMNPYWPGHYNTLRFRTLTTKMLSDARPVPCTASCKVYNSGLVSLTNTRSPHQALANAHAYVCMLQRAGVFDARVLNFKVDNIVAASDFGFRVRLQCMVQSIANPSVMDYNPETFPAAIYREKTMAAPDGPEPPADSRVAVLIFTSGKVICVGFRSMEQLTQVHVKINNIARSFVCDPNDMANVTGGVQQHQEQQMADVDRLMYELICINAPEKAMALLNQAPCPAPGDAFGLLGGGTSNPDQSDSSGSALNALGFDDLVNPTHESDQFITQNTPMLGRLTHEGVQELHAAIDELSNKLTYTKMLNPAQLM